MKVIVCGGRDFDDRQAVNDALARIEFWRGPILGLAHGGASGVDAYAGDWAVNKLGVAPTVYKANWAEHGRAAGPIRNQQMLDEFKPDAVVAFPGGRGTQDMCRKAAKAGVEIINV